MKQLRLEAQLRSETGKGAARAARRSGMIPGVLYGQKKETLSIKLDQKKLRDLLKIEGVGSSLIDLELPGHDQETVMIKEIQRAPVSKEILHTDLIRISLSEEITTTIPVITVGMPVSISEEGGVEEFPLQELQIRCLPDEIPENIEVDISDLEIGDTIQVSDLSIPEGVEVLDDPETAVVGVRPPTIIEEEPAEEEEIILEPEVIGEEVEEEEGEIEAEEIEEVEEREEF